MFKIEVQQWRREVKAMAESLVAKARKSELKTLDDFAPLMGVSVPTLCRYENDPDRYFTPNRLRIYYENVGPSGKMLLKRYISSFFGL